MTTTERLRPYRLERVRTRYDGSQRWWCDATFTNLNAAIAAGEKRACAWWRSGWRVVDARTGAVVHDASTKETR